MSQIRKLVLSSILVSVALVISPFSWFSWGPTKAFPGQHLVNAIAGITLGPLISVLIAITVSTIRIALGFGTIFAYPGSIFGGLIVGIFFKLFKKLVNKRAAIVVASLTEPIGTVLIGGTLAWFILDPFFGNVLHAKFSIFLLYFGWALSSFSGSLIAAILLLALDKIGFLSKLIGENESN